MAMLLAEHADGRLERAAVQVFATDLDEEAIATAREGFYTESDVADVPEQRLERFFHREGRRLSRPPRTARDWCCSRITTSSRIRRSRTSI